MKKTILLLSLFTMILSSCLNQPVASLPAIIETQEIEPTATLAKTIPTITSATIYPPEIHLTLPSGLTIDEYALIIPPATDDFGFTPFNKTQEKILAIHSQERTETFPNNSFFDGGYYSLSTQKDNQKLVARESYTQSGKGVVDVLLGDKEIYTIPIGDGSPINALRGLWAYNGHWILEVAKIINTLDSQTNTIDSNATGQIIKDGELLNNQNDYQEMFGFQLMRDKPFYFFKKGDKIDISYDGQVIPLGYDAVPHYSCCSGATLNPKQAKNMVSFFAQKNGTWYYVEIGKFK